MLVGGMLAVAIYGTAGPTYDPSRTRQLARCSPSSPSSGWGSRLPVLRKAVPRKVLGETVLTTSSLSGKVAIGENATGPYDSRPAARCAPMPARKSASITPSRSAATAGKRLSSAASSAQMHQARVRRGSNLWSEQHNQVEHRLARRCAVKS